MYELAADEQAGMIYVLMTDGEAKVFNGAGSLEGVRGRGRGGVDGESWSCQLITQDPTPRALGGEGRAEYNKWRDSVGLNRSMVEIGDKETGGHHHDVF